MAFPVIQTADTKNGTVTSNSSSWTLTYPTNLASGDLILAFVATDGNSTSGGAPGLPANWNSYYGHDGGGNVTGIIAAKISDGTETGTFSMTLSASEQGGWRIFRITDWFGSGIPATDSGLTSTAKNGDGLSVFGAGSASSTPNPPSLDPANWATEDTLWFATCHVDTSRTISVFPLADLNTSDVSGGAGGATLGLCTLNDAVASKDPGTFTISTSDDWVAATVAVRPAAAATAGGILVPTRMARDRYGTAQR